MNNWCKLNYIMIGDKKSPITKINHKELINYIDDATGNGFEFKVENHSIYYREIK